MKARKYGIFTVTAAAMLMMALFMTSCLNPMGGVDLDPPRSPSPDITAPEGYGVIRLTIAEVVDLARTILPTVPDFPFFEIHVREYVAGQPPLNFQSNAPGNILYSFTHHVFEAGNLTHTIYLPRGDYRIEVLAFTDGLPDPEPVPGIPCPPLEDRPNPGTDLAARGVSGRVTIDAGNAAAGVDVTITLFAIFTGTGQGTFNWNITLPTGPFSQPPVMLVVPRGSQTVPVDGSFNRPAAGGNERAGYITFGAAGGTIHTGNQDLPVGFYDVIITLRRVNHRDRVVREVLHVAENMESTWTINNIPDLVLDTHTVTFVNYNGRLGWPARTIYFTHGSVLGDHRYFQQPHMDPTLSQDGDASFFPHYAFYNLDSSPARVWIGWFTASTGGELWEVNPSNPLRDRIIRDTTLYGRWEEFTRIGITVNPIDNADLSPTFNAVPTMTQLQVQEAALGNVGEPWIQFTAYPPPGVTFSDPVVWRDDLDNIIPLTQAAGAPANSIRLDLTDPATLIRYSAVGTFQFSVTARTAPPPGSILPHRYWSARVNLVITP